MLLCLYNWQTGKQKSSKKLDQSGTYYVINDCDVRRGVFVANINAKRKGLFFATFFRSTAERTK